MLIAVINKSTLVKDNEVDLMCKAIQIQLDLHVAPAWNQKAPIIKFYANQTKVPGYAWTISMLDNPDVDGALGYHSEDAGRVDGFIFAKPVLDNGGVVLHDANNNQNFSVASVLSHEVCEMFGDRFANFWADGPALTQGSEYALELCDPVEGDSYDITLSDGTIVSVSNFVFPSWFNAQATVPQNMPFDYLKKLSSPFTMTPGGYLIVRQSGQVSQVFDKHMPHWKKELKKIKKEKKTNRR
jgi:hypothetical protein